MQLIHLLFMGVAATLVQANTPSTTLNAEDCTSLASLFLPAATGYPFPNSLVANYIDALVEQATPTRPCVIPDVTGAAVDAVKSHVSEIVKWEHALEPAAIYIEEVCKDHPEVYARLARLPWALSNCSTITWSVYSTATVSLEIFGLVTDTADPFSTTDEADFDDKDDIDNEDTFDGESDGHGEDENPDDTDSAGAAPRKTSMITGAAAMAAFVVAGIY